MISKNSRYQEVENQTLTIESIREDIKIEHCLVEDLENGDYAIRKAIKFTQKESISPLLEKIWHYELGLAKKITSLNDGRVFLNIRDSEELREKKEFRLYYESCGSSFYNLLENPENEHILNKITSYQNRIEFWYGMLSLAKGIYELHKNRILHRNICPRSIFINENYEYNDHKEPWFKIGDYSFSFYLYSISKLSDSQFLERTFKNNFHVFRAPESLVFENGNSPEESPKSDFFSFGMFISVILLRIPLESYKELPIENYFSYWENIIIQLDKTKTIKRFESAFLKKCIAIDSTNRFENMLEIIDSINEIIFQRERDFNDTPVLPITLFPKESNPGLRELAILMNTSMQAIINNENNILDKILQNIKVSISDNIDYPFIFHIENLLFCTQPLSDNKNIGLIRLVTRSLNLKPLKGKMIPDFVVLKFKYIKFTTSKNKNLEENGSWKKLFNNARDDINKFREIFSDEELPKIKFMESMNIIFNAERSYEEKHFFRYAVIDPPKVINHKNHCKIIVYNHPKDDLLVNKISESSYKKIFLLNEKNIEFKGYGSNFEWKFDHNPKLDEKGYIMELKGSVYNRNPDQSGWLVFSEFLATQILLKRKKKGLKLIEQKTNLLNALNNPVQFTKFLGISQETNKLIQKIQNIQPIYLIQGPPGTGKTYTATKLIETNLNEFPYSKILVVCKEHEALNDLLKKTIKLVQNKFPKKLIVRSSSKSRNFLHESEEEITNHSDSELADNYFRQFLDWVKNNRRNYPRIFQLFEKDIKDWNSINSGEEWTQLVIDAADMLFATNMSSNIQNLNEGYMGFDLIIQEESGKCYPTELIYPLIAGTKWVLIGDQAQLPPFEYRTIREKVFENLASFDIEKKKQLFPSEKIFDEFTEETDNMIKLFNYIFDKCNEQKEVKYKANTILNNQYRLPPKISDLISSIFYKQIGNFIIETESPPSDWILNPVKFQNHELIWLNTENNPANFEKKGSRYYNLHEVNVIKKLIDNLSFNSKYKKPEISIITPYNQQKEHLEAQLPKKLPSDSEIDIRNSIYSVDSFQGRESDLIIISLVRNNSNTKSLNSIFGFISEKERLNVMLSRSMCAMIVVGNIDLWKEMRGLDSAERLFEVAEFFEKNGLVIKSNDFIEGGKNGRK